MSDIICFWDKSKIQVTAETGKKLKQAILDNSVKTFMLSDNLYSIAGIEKIVDKGTAYSIFPTENDYLKELSNDLTSEESKEWERLEEKEKLTPAEANKIYLLIGEKVKPERIDQKLLNG